MKFKNEAAQLYVPGKCGSKEALGRTTALCIAAHQDDIEIMAYGPIVSCYDKPDEWFTAVVVTDGAGSPRSGIYESYTDEMMKNVRISEQNTAAKIGKYSSCLQLAFPSSAVKDNKTNDVTDEIKKVILECNPDIIYTHNIADKHETHVAVALRVIRAIRELPKENRPQKLISLEVWRGLDWLCDSQKVVLDTSKHPNLAAALLGVYDSQIAGGKRYDLAAFGRRTANATFFASHSVDSSDSVSYGLDLSELMDENLQINDFIFEYIDAFKSEVSKNIDKYLKL